MSSRERQAKKAAYIERWLDRKIRVMRAQNNGSLKSEGTRAYLPELRALVEEVIHLYASHSLDYYGPISRVTGVRIDVLRRWHSKQPYTYGQHVPDVVRWALDAIDTKEDA